MNTTDDQREKARAKEVIRLMEVSRENPIDTLLDVALAGREKNRVNVEQLFSFVQRHFHEDTVAIRGVVINRFWQASEVFLRTTNITDVELKKLRHPSPRPGDPDFESILDEMREQGIY